MVDHRKRIITYGVDNYLQFLALRDTKPFRKNLLDILSITQIQEFAGDIALLPSLQFNLNHQGESFASSRVSADDHHILTLFLADKVDTTAPSLDDVRLQLYGGKRELDFAQLELEPIGTNLTPYKYQEVQ